MAEACHNIQYATGITISGEIPATTHSHLQVLIPKKMVQECPASITFQTVQLLIFRISDSILNSDLTFLEQILGLY